MIRKRSSPVFLLTMIFPLALQFLISAPTQQAVVENPENPPSKNAGRIVQLKELLRITDEKGNFFFKEPADLQVSPDGYIFYSDLQEVLYKFDPRGNFVKNLLVKGEGPGEIRELWKFLLQRQEIFIYDGIGNKIIRKDLDGCLTADLKFGQKRFWQLIAFRDNHYYLLDSQWKDFERKSGIKEVDHLLHIVDEKGKSIPASLNFPLKVSRRYGERYVSISPVNELQLAQENARIMYINHTQDYLIKVLDLEKMEIVRSFWRKYKPVKNIVPAAERHKYREYYEFSPENHDDIQKLLVHRGKLWVLTSTIEKGKGILTDVFDTEGNYLDSFFLPLPRLKQNWIGYPPMAIGGDYLYTVEWDEEGDIFIIRYQIIL